jgi:hypothetical protein
MCVRLVLFDNAREQGWQRKRLPLIKEGYGSEYRSIRNITVMDEV